MFAASGTKCDQVRSYSDRSNKSLIATILDLLRRLVAQQKDTTVGLGLLRGRRTNDEIFGLGRHCGTLCATQPFSTFSMLSQSRILIARNTMQMYSAFDCLELLSFRIGLHRIRHSMLLLHTLDELNGNISIQR